MQPLLNRMKLSDEKICPTAGECDSRAIGKTQLLRERTPEIISQVEKRKDHNPGASISLLSIGDTAERAFFTQISDGELRFLISVVGMSVRKHVLSEDIEQDILMNNINSRSDVREANGEKTLEG
jgi:hypothetical protein